MFIKDFLNDIVDKNLVYYWERERDILNRLYEFRPLLDRFFVKDKSGIMKKLIKNDSVWLYHELENFISNIPEVRCVIDISEINEKVLLSVTDHYSIDIKEYMVIDQLKKLIINNPIVFSRSHYLIGTDGYILLNGISNSVEDSCPKGTYNDIRNDIESGRIRLVDNDLYVKYLGRIPHLVNDWLFKRNDGLTTFTDILDSYYGVGFIETDEFKNHLSIYSDITASIFKISDIVGTSLNLNDGSNRRYVKVRYTTNNEGMNKNHLDCRATFTLQDLLYVTYLCDKIEYSLGEVDREQ